MSKIANAVKMMILLKSRGKIVKIRRWDNKIKVHELTLKIFLLKNVSSEEDLEKISQLIDKSLSKDEKFLNFHINNEYKYYCHNSFFPLEKDKTWTLT